ncbi:MAG: type II restriction endonuclease [Alphaproteobacteria bacterium]|nr:MAG: type II restriction endonuclease [Alphaproteobacteria bacterium]
MPTIELTDWLDEFGGAGFVWYVKRLSGNDTLANGTHQYGPHLKKEFLFEILPSINRTEVKNPDAHLNLYLDSHLDHREARVIYYNNKFHGNPKNGRNETRITNLGGSASALLDPESTGALTVFAFGLDAQGLARDCHVWVCRHETEEDVVEDRIGPVEPGKAIVWPPAQLPLLGPLQARTHCRLDDHEIPASWFLKFPTGLELVRKAIELRPDSSLDPDQRLLRRRDCEYEIFQSVERAIEFPAIKAGFSTVDDFLAHAQSILQRRKARSGRSLELHTRQIFIEEQLKEGQHFSHQPESEPNKWPDFLFPSEAAYKDASFPTGRLRMLAVKTTCKDRWRQVVSEADRIPIKHLLTLQQGVSENQFAEMVGAGVRLVVPTGLVKSFPKSVRPHLQTLESFIGDVRLLTT